MRDVIERGHSRTAAGKLGALSRVRVSAGTDDLEPPAVPNMLLARFLGRLPPRMVGSFTEKQITALNIALLNADPSYHAIDYRASIWLFGIPFYVTFLMGRERRSPERLAREGQVQPHKILIAHIVFALILGFALLSASACTLYLLKSTMGLDLLDGPSPLHALFFN